jgi:hypothetical protein
MRKRDARGSRRCQGRTHAGDDFVGHARARQSQDFLAASAENEWVAPLQADHPQPRLGELDDQPVNVLLEYATGFR